MTEFCPECGGKPTEETLKAVKLHHLGYITDTESYECTECGHRWDF